VGCIQLTHCRIDDVLQLYSVIVRQLLPRDDTHTPRNYMPLAAPSTRRCQYSVTKSCSRASLRRQIDNIITATTTAFLGILAPAAAFLFMFIKSFQRFVSLDCWDPYSRHGHARLHHPTVPANTLRTLTAPKRTPSGLA
jgi:hypothetical protein